MVRSHNDGRIQVLSKTVSLAGGDPAIKNNRLTDGEVSQDSRINFMTVRNEEMVER